MPITQLVSVRGVMAIALTLAIVRALGLHGQIPHLANRNVGLRVILDCTTTLLYLGSLMHLPIGNATAINLASPLIIAMLAVPMLGEHPGPRRWLAIAAGFAGVVMVIKPDVDGFNAWSLMCLAATFTQSLRDLLTRWIPPHVPGLLITLASITFITSVATVATFAQGWTPVSATDVAVLAGAAVLLISGYYLIIQSVREGEMSVISPFRYAGLLVALVAGYLTFGEVPDALAWAGIALLFAAGIYLLHEERRRRDDDLPAA